jgi:hypothetical protein
MKWRESEELVLARYFEPIRDLLNIYKKIIPIRIYMLEGWSKGYI